MKRLIWLYKKAIKFVTWHLFFAFLIINLGALLPALQSYGLEKTIGEISQIDGSFLLRNSPLLFWSLFLIMSYIAPYISFSAQALAVTFGIYDKFSRKFANSFYLNLVRKDYQAFNDQEFIRKKKPLRLWRWRRLCR